MRIHQLNIQYLAEEDRLIFKLNTHEGEEFQFFFTRRFVKILMPLIAEYLMKIKAKTVMTEAQQDSISQFEHQHALSKTELKKPYQEKPQEIKSPEVSQESELESETEITIESSVNSDDPILAHGFKLFPSNENNYQLCLFPKEGQGIEITIDKSILHSFYHLLEEGIKVAEWDLPVAFNEISIPAGEKPH